MKKFAPFLSVKLLSHSLFCTLLFCFLCNFLFAQKKGNASPVQKSIVYTYKIIEGNNNTFGYDIYADKTLLIHQPSVPSLPGNNGFSIKAGAEKVAGLVIKKIQKGEMPPTISAKEMKALKAI